MEITVVGVVIVTHSHLLAEGLKQIAIQCSRGIVKIASAGGVDDLNLGTNAGRIHEAIGQVYSEEGVVILFDFGSSLFSAQIAMEMLPQDQRNHIRLSDAPLVEGTVVAAVESSLGHSLDKVYAAVDQTRGMNKVNSSGSPV